MCVTIPAELRQSFKGQKQIKRSTGTSDKRIAENRRPDKTYEIFREFESVLAKDHPYVKAGQAIIDLTHEIQHGFAAEQLLQKSTSFEAMQDILARAGYAQRIDWMGKGDPETAIGIADVQQRMENALLDFEEQAAAFLSKNKVEGFRLSNKPLISEVLERWLDNSNVSRAKTINTYASHVRRFVKFSGDEPIDVITKLDANRYIQHLVNSGLAHSTIETAVAAMRGLLHFAEENGYVEVNSFSGLRLRGKGKPPRRRATFSQSQLSKLFQLPMKDRDKLCLKILSSTGMRLDEVALLTFEDLKVDEDTGIRFFDLTDDVKLFKNDAASRRQVPVPDQLVLPSGQGRL
ncbi:MAG: site-specific integrase, partial [Paracoccaceae bacterium]